MPFRKYFRVDQKLLLRPISEASGQERVETLTAFFIQSNGDLFDLRLPYESPPGEGFPFNPGMPCELHSESIGLGLRLTGNFAEQVDPARIRIQVNQDLQAFQRRLHPRSNGRVGLQFTRGRGTLRSFRQQWEKNVRILEQNPDPTKLPTFSRSEVNISAGGIRFQLKPPALVADLCMVLIQLEPDSLPICTLGEIVWLAEIDDKGLQAAGMQFIDILKRDQQRLAEHVKQAPSDQSGLNDKTGV